MASRWRRALGVFSIPLVPLVALSPATSQAPAPAAAADFHTLRTKPLAAGEFEVVTLSTLPDAVTGGDVLVAVRGLAPAAAVTIRRNGVDVTGAFIRQKDGELRGLVSGLADGANDIVATSGGRSASLTVVSHPITGPVVSGPHQTPFICRTEDNGLGKPLDANCTAATQMQWFYRSSRDQRFHELDPSAAYPQDVMQTETIDGRVVPYVVRVESATVNRGITRIGVLDDPASRDYVGHFDGANWNKRVYYVYGESCAPGYNQGSASPQYVLNFPYAEGQFVDLQGISNRLSKGDLIVYSTLSTYGVHCNPLISIETAMMLKEYIIERYGPIERLVSTGGSGGALQQYNAANNAPGLLTAAMPVLSFADPVTTGMTVADCGLLTRYYENSDLNWSDTKRAAVNGHLPGPYATSICQSWVDTFLPLLTEPGGGCVPEELAYDPKKNPTGARCTLQDANVNVIGRDPATGFARLPMDNTGIQYGLGALNSGAITVDEFLDMNTKIGGYDIDGNPIPSRMRMDSDLAATLYRIGYVIGRGALADTPILDNGVYVDPVPLLNIHEAVRPFVIRERLRAYTGQTASQAIWRGVHSEADTYPVMEEWVDALKERGEAGVAAVTSAKPEGAGDRCSFGTIGGRLDLGMVQLPAGAGQIPLVPGGSTAGVNVPLRVDVAEDFSSGVGPCSVLLPVSSTPRIVSGGPLSDDVIRCQLKPLDPADYQSPLSPAEFAKLRDIFPSGVCDWSKPAAEMTASSILWPSVGGAKLEAPHGLTWRVGRSSTVLSSRPGRPQPGGPQLPATGVGSGPALVMIALAAAGVLLLTRRRA